MNFSGHTYRTLDAKGRLVLPPEHRDILNLCGDDGRCMFTMVDGCIRAFPWAQWVEFESKFKKLVNPSKKVRDFRRMTIGGAEEMILDAQNRVRLSRAHMEYAGITKEVVILGILDHFEIWDVDKYKALCSESYDDVSADLSEMGIDILF